VSTIFYRSIPQHCRVSVDSTSDANYARQCFDGSDREWSELTQNVTKRTRYYIVSSGLQGAYMSDSVSVYTNKRDAISDAREQVKRAKEENEEDAQ
jgi:hypothetical protein